MVTSTPTSLTKYLKRVILRNSPVFWANIRPALPLLGRVLPLKSPPILIVSLPRSGSSWVGELMGQANNTMYLREPITQTFASSAEINGPSFFEIDPDTLPLRYKTSADTAFAGIPAFPYSIVRYPKQWTIIERTKKYLLIKEVNPLALKWIITAYKPRVIYLIRHPAAVANSFFKLGWTGNQFERRFSPKTLASKLADYKNFTYSFWAEHGAMQSIIIKLSMEILKNYPDHLIVKYEDICAEPIRIFRELFEHFKLEWSHDTEDKIITSSTSDGGQISERYGTYRNSKRMINQWKTEVSQKSYNEIREAYLYFDPPYYRNEEWC